MVVLGLRETWKLFPRDLTVPLRGVRANAEVGELAPNSDSPHIEQRLAELEKKLHQGMRELRQQVQGLAVALDSEAQKRQNGEQRGAVMLERAVAKGIPLEMMGVIWLFFGIIFGTVPGELACVFGWLWTS